ncbi:NAD-dependent epimerase/dehydratase family protein [Exiguobacterium algae]|uniref:NAD-dependent epimerase/dehydratase family protein n=1 Tax=Exiguobacterium algae TaxID=2751250 RepID=UPI001BE5570D|nr:NAD(P)-dependent oxidoreductase [Exiguobacterium algae]
MNILITGGYGFLGSAIAERFFKEGHHIHILDNLSTGSKQHIDFKHRSLIADVADHKCESFFRTYSFDVVIHCANPRVPNVGGASNQSNMNGLLNLLTLSEKYHVKQFLYCSTSEVYGHLSNDRVTEHSPSNPLTPMALDALHGEAYCAQWSELHQLSTLVFRLPHVYGPKQQTSHESRFLHHVMKATMTDEDITLSAHRDDRFDLIFVGDVVDAMYRSVISQLQGVYNLSSNTLTSAEDVTTLLGVTPVFQNTDLPQHSLQLENRKLTADLDWVPRFTPQEGFAITREYYEKTEQTDGAATETSTGRWKQLFTNPILRSVENLTLFAMFLVGSLIMTPIVDTPDYWFIYVLLAALLFGKSQALLASIMAVGVHFYEHAATGRNVLSLFVDNTILAVFTIYLLIGLVVSYVMERRKIEIQFLKDELAATTERHVFLNDIYEETLTIKNQLQQQILHSEESIGSVYEATRSLDSLEPEGLFVGSISVLEKTLKADQFAIYVINQSSFARLAAKSAASSFAPHNSLQIDEHSVVQDVIRSKDIVFNTSLSPGEAVFGAPLVRQGEVFAIILCYDVPFQNLTLSYRNLIDVMTRLINTSLDRSFGYIDAVQFDRYVADTNALKSEYFERILVQKEQAKRELHIPYTLLHIQEAASEEVARSVETTLRTTDYLGYRTDGRLYALLSNATREESQIVIDRLAHKAIQADVVEDALYVD